MRLKLLEGSMLKTHLAACLVTSALVVAPALAQTSPPLTQPGADHFLAQEQPGQWRGSKLVGLNVYGPENEKVGDINEIIVDASGKLDAVVIGVGGFLGIGGAPAGTVANPNPPAGT